MCCGKAPFRDKNRKKLHEKILNRKPVFPTYLSGSTCSFIKKLLQRNPERRLGSQKSTMFETRGVVELKNDGFFQGTNWVHVFERKRKAPHVPTVNGELDTSNFDEEFTRSSVLDSPKPSFKEPSKDGRNSSPSRLFRGFSWQDESFMDMHYKRERGNSRSEVVEDVIDDRGGDGTITVEEMTNLELPKAAVIDKKDIVPKKIIMKECSVCLKQLPESDYSRSQMKRGPRRVCKICIQTNRTRPIDYTPNAKEKENGNAVVKDNSDNNVETNNNDLGNKEKQLSKNEITALEAKEEVKKIEDDVKFQRRSSPLISSPSSIKPEPTGNNNNNYNYTNNRRANVGSSSTTNGGINRLLNRHATNRPRRTLADMEAELKKKNEGSNNNSNNNNNGISSGRGWEKPKSSMEPSMRSSNRPPWGAAPSSSGRPAWGAARTSTNNTTSSNPANIISKQVAVPSQPTSQLSKTTLPPPPPSTTTTAKVPSVERNSAMKFNTTAPAFQPMDFPTLGGNKSKSSSITTGGGGVWGRKKVESSPPVPVTAAAAATTTTTTIASSSPWGKKVAADTTTTSEITSKTVLATNLKSSPSWGKQSPNNNNNDNIKKEISPKFNVDALSFQPMDFPSIGVKKDEKKVVATRGVWGKKPNFT